MFVKLRLNADSRFCIIWGNSFSVNNKVKGYKYLHKQKLLMSKKWHIHLDTKSYPVRYEHLSDIKLVLEAFKTPGEEVDLIDIRFT